MKVVMLSVMQKKQRIELFLSLLASVGHGQKCSPSGSTKESPEGCI